ncbi:MAG TPA: xanthine dehydrogenase, partial [candidate division Zixibacteria bacterium]|nr:xanthine dehydrogenase [candidate division Zixibacteria bacterium]
FGAIHPHQMVLCSDKVRFFGDAVAVVAAETLEIAEEAVALITVEYEPFPVVTDPRAALESDSPQVHENGNLCFHHKVRKGDIADGFAHSDIVLEREYSTQRIEHSYIEPEAILVEPGENGGVTITGSLQNLYNIRRALSRVLNLPLNRIRLIQASLGGSFGGKDEVMSAICARGALLTLATGRPVKMVNSREDSMRESYKRHPYKLKYKVGASTDGTLQAMEITIHADAGAYSAMSPFVTWRSVVQATGPYIVPNVKTDVFAAYTNNCYTSAMRGFGSPQICFAAESLMDELAEALGLDPLELRLKNILKDNCSTATGQILSHKVSVGEALSNVTKGIEFGNIWKANRKKKYPSKIAKGIGLSCSYRGVSLGAEGTDAAGVAISIQTDGSAVVSCGLVDMGQGAATTISMVVAEELGISIDRIRFLCADTTSIPDSGPTVASRTSFMAGNAARVGAQELMKRIKPVAAEMLDCPDSSLIFSDNQIRSTIESVLDKSIFFGDLAAACFRKGISLFAHGWYKSPTTTWDEHTGQGDAYFTYVYAANLAEVEVDLVTGQVKVTRFVSSHDVGRTLNLNGAKGQIYGGVAMGLGYALLEDYAQDDGLPSLSNFDEYLLPTICDIPDIDIILIENPDSLGPFGAKSLGEPACELAAPAIVNAVANATGLRVRDLPLTLERVLLGKSLVRSGARGSTKSRSEKH